MKKGIRKTLLMIIALTIIFQMLIPIIPELNIEVLAESNDIVTEIYTKEDFFDFIDEVNKNNVSYNGKKIRLMNDIDLETSIENPSKTVNMNFKGDFDGQNYTIYNLYLNQPLFEKINGNIKNLNIENARN